MLRQLDSSHQPGRASPYKPFLGIHAIAAKTEPGRTSAHYLGT